MKHGSRTYRNGFAMVVVLMLLTLISIAVTAMAVSARVDAGRTLLATDQAQLRQLLLAGADAAPRIHFQHIGETLKVQLPQSLNERHATLLVTFTADGFDVDASLGRHRAAEHLAQVAGTWTCTLSGF